LNNLQTTSKSGKTVLTIAQNEAISFMQEKSGLKRNFLTLIIAIFSIIIKKTLIENGELNIWFLGRFNLKIFKRNHKLRKYSVSFFASDKLKEAIKGKRTPQICTYHSKILKKKFVQVAAMLGIEVKDVKFLFSLYTYCIIIYLLKYKEYKIPMFGKFMLVDVPRIKNTPISKKYDESNVNTKVVVFKLMGSGKEEINRRSKSIKLSKRLKRMFYFSGIDSSIKSKPRFLKDNDAPKATLKIDNTHGFWDAYMKNKVFR
jgi:nucleoid DNA-binding protein